MHQHELDNPVWHSLTSGNKTLGFGNDQARYFHAEISPFAAVHDNTPAHLEALRETLPHNNPFPLVTIGKLPDSPQWTILDRIPGFQMLFEGATPEDSTGGDLVSLTTDHVPHMLALTRLNPPGPFLSRTIEFGGYEGVFAGDQLIAMAGRRFDSGSYVEISAVCTHPDHTGKGYARQLLNSQIRQIRAEGKKPYLHVRADNTRACRIYQTMGFVIRTNVFFDILAKS